MSEKPQQSTPPSLPKKRSELRVGPFVLLDEVGSGAHARLFRARYRPRVPEKTIKLEEDDVVVLKVLRDSAVRDPQLVDAFTREAELLVMIDHPSVVRGITRGVTSGRMWSAIEYVEGEDLSTLMGLARQEGLRLRPDVALALISDLLAGLAAAQALMNARGRTMGLIHRDVSPRNVMIDIRGQVKLIDFGTALLSLTEEPKPGVVGSPGYLSPEQARGDQLTQGVDVYAVGILAYELLTGRRCFAVENYTDKALLEAHAEARRAPWPRNVDVPQKVRQVIDHALGPTPEERPADAAAFFRELAPLVTDAEDGRRRLAAIAYDLVTTNPERPPPLFV